MSTFLPPDWAPITLRIKMGTVKGWGGGWCKKVHEDCDESTPAVVMVILYNGCWESHDGEWALKSKSNTALTFSAHLTQAPWCTKECSQSVSSQSHKALCKCLPSTLWSSCENPWGRSKVDGFISACSRESAHRLDLHFYIIFLQPTHASYSPTSDMTLSDRMWLTSSGSGMLNSSSITPIWWIFPPPFFSAALTVNRNGLRPSDLRGGT